MVLRLVTVPSGRALEALDAHLAHLQDSGRPVVLVAARLPADYLIGQLRRTDLARLAVIDVCSPAPPRPTAGVHIEHLSGPHMVELLRVRARRIMQRVLRQAAHVVYDDVEALARVLPVDIGVQLTRETAASSRPDTWTDLIVPDAWRMPAALRAVYDDVVPDRLQVTADAAGTLEPRRCVA